MNKSDFHWIPDEAKTWLIQSPEGDRWTRSDLETLLSDSQRYRFDEKGSIATVIKDATTSGLVSLLLLQECCCIPLNPNWSESELLAILESLKIETLIVDGSPASYPKSLFKDRNVISVQRTKRQLSWQTHQTHVEKRVERPPRALVLLTSGTSGTSKAVPLTHSQLHQAAQTINQSLQISPRDRCLNFLPMMHIGGLLDLLIAPLHAGSQVVFCDLHSPDHVATLIEKFSITWLQGAPAMLKHLLQATSLPKERLRLIRSVSAPLPPSLLAEIETNFACPVIEIYGMSETTGVITSNPLPPAKRKKGSVGIPLDLEIKIDSHQQILVKGERVFSFYLNHPTSHSDWFPTGDLGYIDDEGYLFITGRSKDIINRGGQKIAPAEIDNLVESWPEIAHAAAYSIPHSSLGEEVALAIVVSEGEEISQESIQQRLADQLAPYKLPRRIDFVTKLPLNENGKLQRHLLTPEATSIPSNLNWTSRERQVAEIWKANLKPDKPLTPASDYFELGGDSLGMTALITSLERSFHVSFQTESFLENSTIRKQASLIEELLDFHPAKIADSNQEIAPNIASLLQRALQSWPGKAPFPDSLCRSSEDPDSSKPLFFYCSNSNEEWALFQDGAPGFSHIGFRSLFGLQKRKRRDLEGLASCYATEIKRNQPTGPFYLGGYCAGAIIMELVARKLIGEGRKVQYFLTHDQRLTSPLPCHTGFLFSSQWRDSPLLTFPSSRIGLERLLGPHFDLFHWDGSHHLSQNPDYIPTLKSFLPAPNTLSHFTSSPAKAEPESPRYRLAFVKTPPRTMKVGQQYPVTIKLTNTDTKTFHSTEGFSLSARWNKYDRKRRIPTQPRDLEKTPGLMRLPLPSPLPPGESIELPLTILPEKGLRLETLQIALILEGCHWFFSAYSPNSILEQRVLIR